MHDARDGRLEPAGDAVHIGAALLGHALRHFLFGDFQLLDADQLFLEGLRRAGIVADFVGASAIRHLDVLVAVRELAQNLADAADRPGDGERAEHGETGQHGDDKQADAKIDAADAPALGARLRVAVFGGADQILGRLLDQHVHLPAEIGQAR